MPDLAATHATRTYVVLCCRRLLGVDAPPGVGGTVVACDRATARTLGRDLAMRQEPDVAREAQVRVVRVSACRRAWLLVGLARDGAAKDGAPADGATPDGRGT